MVLLGAVPAVFASGPEVVIRLVAPAALAPGAKAPVVVEMTLGQGWHVNGHAPSQSYLIPTVVSLTASGGALSAVRYPTPRERRYEFADEPLAVYEGKVRFESQLTLPETASGKVSIEGVLSYQACNDHQCFAPARAAFAGTVAVGRASAGKE